MRLLCTLPSFSRCCGANLAAPMSVCSDLSTRRRFPVEEPAYLRSSCTVFFRPHDFVGVSFDFRPHDVVRVSSAQNMTCICWDFASGEWACEASVGTSLFVSPLADAPSPPFLAAAVQTWQRHFQSASIFLLVGTSPRKVLRIFTTAALTSFDLTTS